MSTKVKLFPDNYMWDLATMVGLNSGGAVGEVLGLCSSDEMQKASETGDIPTWVAGWTGLAERVEKIALSEVAAGHNISAAESFTRAAVYLQVAERVLDREDPKRAELFRKSQRLFREFCARRAQPIDVVEFPYEEHMLEAYLIPAAPGTVPEGGKAPCVVFLDGLDASIETMTVRALPLAQRGIACLVVDGPGWGASLRFKNLITRYDYEVVTAAALDYLETRPELDADRFGVMAISLGGYYAPRVAAFEPRFKAGAAWGAQWDYPEILQGRIDRGWTVSSAVSAPKHQASWVFGVDTLEEAVTASAGFRLDGVAQKVTCPFLIVHGEADSQIPLSHAQALYDALGSEDKELRVFTREESGAEHCQWDNVVMAQHYIFDWLQDRLVRA